MSGLKERLHVLTPFREFMLRYLAVYVRVRRPAFGPEEHALASQRLRAQTREARLSVAITLAPSPRL